jgi:methylmalonyl-CoA/ethylmalonyl-CoA epimerase
MGDVELSGLDPSGASMSWFPLRPDLIRRVMVPGSRLEDTQMNGAEELRAGLGLPPVTQIGVVVRDVDAAVESLSSKLGLGPFAVYEFVPEKHWFKEEECALKLGIGKAMWGDLELELIQPLEGKGLHKEFLGTHGEGLQHLGFLVSDYDEMFGRFTKAGFRPLERAETYLENYEGYLRACYFDTHKVGGIVCEIFWKSWLLDS